MTKAEKHTADASKPPLPQQRDERGGVGSVTQQTQGATAADRETEPKLPHERDQTADDQPTSGAASADNRDKMRQAHDDLASGKQDTDRGPEADRAYRQLRNKKSP